MVKFTTFTLHRLASIECPIIREVYQSPEISYNCLIIEI